MSDVFATAGQSQGRTAIALLQTLLNGAPSEVLPNLGALHRSSTWENITLHRGLAGKGIDTGSTPAIPVDNVLDQNGNTSVTDGGSPQPISANGVATDLPAFSSSSPSRPSKSDRPKDLNATALKHITQGLPNALAPFFQGQTNVFLSFSESDAPLKLWSKCSTQDETLTLPKRIIS